LIWGAWGPPTPGQTAKLIIGVIFPISKSKIMGLRLWT
jgi:hypothetical protein